MSLIVWYPLIRDLKNQGLSVTTDSSGSPTFISSQFGYGLDLSKQISLKHELLHELKTFSISFWVKINPDSNLSEDWRDIFSIGDNNAEETAAGTLRIQTSYGSNKDSHGIVGPCNNNGYNICQSNMGVMIATKGDWHHVCIVANYEEGKVKSYLDGIQKNQVDHNGGHLYNGWFTLGKTDQINGVMNDLKIYNHALSTKEIKELSKGLILHHALKGYGAGENILPLNALYYSSIEDEGYRGQTVFVRYTTATTESYLGWGRSNQVDQSTQYTFSCYLWVNSNVKSVDYFWLSDTESNKKTGTSYVNITSKSNNLLTPYQWNYVTWTFTTKADDYTGYIRIDNNGSKTEGEHAILKACCPKLEKGSKATPYIPYSLTTGELRTVPSTYAPLEYIESTGTQYINTEYVHKATTRIDMVCNVSSNPVAYNYSYHALFGDRLNTYQTNAFTFFSRFSSSNIPVFCRSGAETRGTGFIYDEKILVSAYDKTCTWYKYGSSTASGSVTTTGTADAGVNAMFLFNLNKATTAGGATPDTSWINMKLYGCKIWDDNGTTLVRDFIPAMRKSDSKIGLYDAVNDAFYINAGSGEFLTSPEIIEDDLSGNGFNGTRQGVTFTPDSPRYYMSTEFDANKDLVLSTIYNLNSEVSNLSVSIWFNVSATGDKNLWNFGQNSFWRHRFANSSSFQSLAVMGGALQDIRFTIDPIIQYNTWYHNVMTFDNGIFKCYLNGELIGTVDKSSVATTIKRSSNNGHWSLGDYTTGSEALIGNLSDFRIYAKTLTADEVNELYQTSTSIDKSGKVYCGEFVEE